MNTLQAIKERTSYRGKYKNCTVPREDLTKIMEAGLDAPSGCNQQTTSLIAVDDPKILERLHDSVKPFVGKTAPAIICVLTQKICAYNNNSYYMQDYSAAIENMLLACVELGYQSCWVEGYVKDTDNNGHKMANILGVPKNYELVCYMPIGIADEPLKQVSKKDFSQRAWFNGFGKSE